MTFKYLYVMGEHVPGVSQLYDLCHVPFDEILISALRKYGFKHLGRRGAASIVMTFT